MAEEEEKTTGDPVEEGAKNAEVEASEEAAE